MHLDGGGDTAAHLLSNTDHHKLITPGSPLSAPAPDQSSHLTVQSHPRDRPQCPDKLSSAFMTITLGGTCVHLHPCILKADVPFSWWHACRSVWFAGDSAVCTCPVDLSIFIMENC